MYDFRREIEPNTPCEFSPPPKKKNRKPFEFPRKFARCPLLNKWSLDSPTKTHALQHEFHIARRSFRENKNREPCLGSPIKV